jgi:DNA-binding SARP family transcriptional activator
MPDFRILGPLEVSDETGPLLLGGQKQRAVLALLVVDAGRVVSTDHLVDALWGEQPPRTAVTSLQNFVSQLRKLLGPEILETKPPGYRLNVRPGELDLHRFRAMVERARTLEPPEKAATLREALALWRGPPLAEFRFGPREALVRPLLELVCLLRERGKARLEPVVHSGGRERPGE